MASAYVLHPSIPIGTDFRDIEIGGQRSYLDTSSKTQSRGERGFRVGQSQMELQSRGYNNLNAVLEVVQGYIY